MGKNQQGGVYGDDVCRLTRGARGIQPRSQEGKSGRRTDAMSHENLIRENTFCAQGRLLMTERMDQTEENRTRRGGGFSPLS